MKRSGPTSPEADLDNSVGIQATVLHGASERRTMSEFLPHHRVACVRVRVHVHQGHCAVFVLKLNNKIFVKMSRSSALNPSYIKLDRDICIVAVYRQTVFLTLSGLEPVPSCEPNTYHITAVY